MADMSGVTFEEMKELMNYGARKKSRRKAKRRGRRKGSRNKITPEITRKLGDATLQYALGNYEQAISILKEIILLSPNLPGPYHTLGLIYDAMGDRKRSFNFYMLAAHLQPKDASLWKLLVTWSIEQGNSGQARYCLSKAITADPEDKNLRFHRAALFIELGDFQKAAESYEHISRLSPDVIEPLRTATELYRKCGQHERAVTMLEAYLKEHPNEPDLSVVNLLVVVNMERKEHLKALELIERTQQVYSIGKEMPLYLSIKAGLCHAHLGNLEKAEVIFGVLQQENHSDHTNIIIVVADTLMSLQQYESALKYYRMLEGDDEKNNINGLLDLKIARCCLSVENKVDAVKYFYKAIHKLDYSVDARLTLSTLLLGEGKDDEAIAVLSPPSDSDSSLYRNSERSKPSWLHGSIKLNLCKIYKAKGLQEEFVNAIFPVIRQTLFLENVKQKVRIKPRLTRSVLSERIKVVGECQGDAVFHGFRPLASALDLSKAARARKRLQKVLTMREAERAAALADGIDWKSDDSEDDSPPVPQELPLPNLLKEEEYHILIIDVCKALSSLQRYWEALEIINLTLKLASNTLSTEKKQELRTLGAQIAYNISDPTHGFDYARYIVNQHPDSYAAWNCYYKVVSRLDNRHSKHNKFLHAARTKHKDCVPPILISGHQFTMISQHQAAARDYLEAYKLMPDNALVNLCAGTALINLALGFRLQNKHQCVLQGLAFLFNNLRLCGNNQEALFNIARAYHHIGMVTLAVKYYEKVLAIHQDDYPIPRLPNENPDEVENRSPGYCDLRREASYNLQKIYLKSGAIDLARQITKDYCTI
ncbi:hypothetical protein Leryth_016565 [Lithospermum erythrorhizon]|nr:hypothetical protein Leryth_016565 [Lithospermum erythrorhizon]